jgi:MFS family permease
MWRSLRHRNYRLYLSGQLVSLCGTWMQQIAQSWLVYRLTGSATALGIVSFAGQIPVFVLAPIAGVFSDRFSRYKIALFGQILLAILALALAVLTLFGDIRVWHIVVLGLAQGIILAFDMPARQSLVNQLVDAENLSNAIALNSSIVNAARILGPAVAGIVVATVGEGICFFINALSYLAVIWGLLLMKLPASPQSRAGSLSMLGSLSEGASYIRDTLPVRDLLLLLGLIGLMGMPYITLMPVFAGEIIRGGAHALGMLMGAVGAGALIGALALARRSGILGLGKVIVAATSGFGVGLILFALSRMLWLSMAILVVVGFSWMMLIAASNTVLQTLAADDMRGRVMSLFSMMLVGMAPFGSLVCGALADVMGAPITIMINGCFCALGGIMFGLRLPRLREAALPILKSKGLIQESGQRD